MKTLPASPARLIASALALGVVSTFPAAAQPSSGLPSSYTYMGAPPPGYPASTPPAASTQRRPATTPQRSAAPVPRPSPPKTTMPHGYGPIPDSLSMQVAQLAANDQQQEGRIRKLEKDVSGIKSSGGVRFTSGGTDTAAASLRPHTSYVVRPGDSLWRIASAHRVAPGEVMSLNRMKSDTVVIGQTLMIPAPHGSSTSSGTTQATFKPYYHDVRPGDTSSTISKKYNVSRNALMAANPRVDFGGGLIPGSRVVIPGKSTQVTTSKPSSAPASPGGSYIVKPGDSLKAIAIKHGTSTANLAALNGIKDVNKVVVGQRIVLPGGKAPSTSRSTASA
ncbi:MAG: LysM peptidoglycan-binding domain-containing protein, partial [Verrucomicrobiaceae bacterium]|nr:LysM peptidoglycan-binding domain-containing protein [Verrucomicrobiaceae bacterium]